MYIEHTNSRFNVHADSGQDSDSDQFSSGTAVDVEQEQKTQLPKMYKVLLLNDDFTPMDFVILVLRKFFGKNEIEATAIMLAVHNKGSGIAGVFALEIAEMKVMQVNQLARQSKFPLKSTMEPE